MGVGNAIASARMASRMFLRNVHSARLSMSAALTTTSVRALATSPPRLCISAQANLPFSPELVLLASTMMRSLGGVFGLPAHSLACCCCAFASTHPCATLPPNCSSTSAGAKAGDTCMRCSPCASRAATAEAVNTGKVTRTHGASILPRRRSFDAAQRALSSVVRAHSSTCNLCRSRPASLTRAASMARASADVPVTRTSHEGLAAMALFTRATAMGCTSFRLPKIMTEAGLSGN
mmetsp:Transcript_113270/g.283713  ORF Transcript_113270/g.283713 Transcript_113270/m.283713 type:complete len:235 (-) Transcript_113270:268-972(-)